MTKKKTENKSLYEFRVRRVRRSFAREGRVTSPESVLHWLVRHCEELDRETFFALYLDVSGKVIGYEVIAVGGIASVEVFRGALLAGAFAIVVAHNHPSGNPEHSDEDVGLARRMMRAGELIGIEVLDSIVLARGQFSSLAIQMHEPGFNSLEAA
jgi:DNA repair protein RadC